MNLVFFAIILASFAFAGYSQFFGGPFTPETLPMQVMTKAMADSAAAAVTLAIGLVGTMALFLGLMKVAEEGGLLAIIARLIRPLMVRLFPDVPAESPAMGAMILNISANALGLGNAATPFGIRAMQELDSLNPEKGTATNAMALFLTINTAGITLLPTTVIALRASAGSANPAGILGTTLFASGCATLVAIAAAKIFQRFSPAPAVQNEKSQVDDLASGRDTDLMTADPGYPLWVSALALVFLAALIPLAVIWGRTLSPFVLPAMMLGFLTFGLVRGVRIYETFVEGAREGFQVAVRIIPYLVAILVAVGMFQASGAMTVTVSALGKWTALIGLPADALPMALMRPLSGSGSYGILAATLANPAIGPDSYTGTLVSTLMGSSETTFYVMAVYFGAVQVRRVRHTLLAALTADAAGIFFSILACRFFLMG